MTREDMKLEHSEMIGAIERSGYLIESQIAELLANAEFFVETNQVIRDPLTGKSREIDVLAELFLYQEKRTGIASRIKFVFEAKNNPLPLVLLTELKFSPDVDLIESLRQIRTPERYAEEFFDAGFWRTLIGQSNKGIHTQYCTFKRKKDSSSSELMAYHPDELHDSIVKIVQYCDEQISFWKDRKPDDYFREFLYLPIVVLGGLLYELTPSTPPKLKQVRKSRLVFNYYHGEEPKSALIYMVTMDGFATFIKEMIQTQRKVEDQLMEARTQLAQKASPNTANNDAG